MQSTSKHHAKLRVDSAPLVHFIAVAVASCLWLVVCIIIGSAGPKSLVESSYWAYDCPGGSSDFNETTCSGFFPASGNASPWYEVETGALSKDWYLILTPYSTKLFGVEQEVTITATTQGYDIHKGWITLTDSASVVSSIVCYESSPSCVSFVLLFEDLIYYERYRTSVAFGRESADFLGQAKFTFTTTSDSFSRLTLGFRITFLILTLGLLVAFVLKLSKSEWTWEQKFASAMLVGLLGYNNAISALDYITPGWFASFASAVLELAFTCTMFMFWLLFVDRFRSGDSEQPIAASWTKLPKFGVVILYGLIGCVLYGWSSVRDRITPIFGLSQHITGIQVMYYLSSALYIAVILWLSIMIVLSLPAAYADRSLLPRFMFFAIPTGICVISMLIAIFTGSLGTFGRTTLSFMYFIGLFNNYVFLLVWGYWPSERPKYQVVAGPTEASTLFTPDNKPTGYA